MRRLSPVNIGAMGLTVLFICICGGVFLARNYGGPWLVITERNEAARTAVSEEEEDTWPRTLLPGEQIDLNTALEKDLTRLPQIGKKRAADIVAYREEYGPFSELEDLMNVPGIGTGTFEEIKEYIAVSDVE